MEENELEHRVTEVESRSKSNQHRIKDLEERQNNLDELVGSVKVLAVREERLEDDVKEIKKDVKTLTVKPIKRWESIVDKILLTIVGAAVGFILAQIGL